jgi:neopullulanase
MPTWRSSLAVSLAALFLLACPGRNDEDEPPEAHPYPVRACTTRIVFDDGQTHGRITAAGTFNCCSETADHLELEPGTTYAVELNLEPGEYAYKLIVGGQWRLDPANLRTIFHGGEENSRLIVPDCNEPSLRVDRFDVDGAAGAVSLEVQYVDGAGLAGPDLDALSVRLDRSPVGDGLEIDEETGRITVSLEGLAPGKYALDLTIADAEGKAAESLFLPFWVEETPFDWNGAVLYFAFVDRFRNGDPSLDDPVPDSPWLSNYQGGDFIGLRHAIEEGWFDDLGVDAIWITAPQENPDGRWGGDGDTTHTGYHGYWPSAPRDTQPRFGSLDDLREMIRAAHDRGIRVLADVVLNHVHESHPHFQENPDWFIGDGGCVCGRTCDWEAQAIECWFTPYLPVYQWQRPEVLREVLDDVMWWVRETNLDGFRVDAVKHFERVALRNLRASLVEIEADAPVEYLLIGETFTGDGGHGDIAAYIAHDQLHGQFDFPLYWPLARVLARDEGTFHDLDAAVQASDAAYPEGAIMGPFLGNHDVPRFYSHAAGDIFDVWGNGAKEQGWNDPPGAHDWDEPYERLHLAFAFVLTQPGMPLIYYGDEVGLPGAGDPDNRRFMPWGDEVTGRGEVLLERVRRLGKVRAAVPALRTGARQTLHVTGDVYVYARDAGDGELAIVALNRADVARTADVTLTGSLENVPRLTFEHQLREGVVVAESGILRLSLPARSAAILTPAR